MGKIRALSEELIGKIAAGEVVERPAAAIKELVENSLDAGATAVTVEIRDGGTTYIRVADNGCGIDESDIRMAFERHATSKISREQDLNAISTLGFRGEALASIAAVSRITMTTRTADRETGLKIKNEGGQITDIQETACPVGTTVVVNDLFFNVPVRKYDLMIRDPEQAEKMIAAIPKMMEKESIPAMRKTKTALKECDIKPLIYELKAEGQHIYAILTLTEKEACKPAMLTEALSREAGTDSEIRMLVTRTGLLGEDENGHLVPLERL